MKTFINFFLSFIAIGLFSNVANGQDKWIKKANFPGAGRIYAESFSIGNRAYICGGDTSDDFQSGFPLKSDLWEYNPDSNKWTQKADIPFSIRFAGVCFSIGNKGFVGGGDARNDFWEYDPSNNTWTRKADIPGASRLYPASFAIGGKGYTGMGFVWGKGNVLNDFWGYDTLTNNWSRKANFGGVPKVHAVGFSIGNKGFVGTGEDSSFNTGASKLYNDFWEYDPRIDKWTKKANIGLHGRELSIGFSMANKGYIGFGIIDSVGTENDMWAYDTTANQWKQMLYCAQSYTVYAPFAFSIGNKAFVGSGKENGGNFHNDFYQYTDHTSGINTPENKIDFNIYPNPNAGNFSLTSSYPIESYSISDINGKEIYSTMVTMESTNTINIDLSLQNGLYLVRVITNNGTAVKKVLVAGN